MLLVSNLIWNNFGYHFLQALQTFEVLRKIGKHHDFSAGLVIGGKVCFNFCF